ncbi:TetR/AcrR family transcriptional regulator C-terminal domain-containing protein [Nocardiopsis trehalosi]|jgi:hypothetical protein|uniref:TetR/AcrR family transcriptional regulator C-terminal domain-containing protein n=1 Tax=Nocardiopsis trehalosi TaxID=109329 RepID=UPI00082ADC1A|nr:TetR/AcrR family transcriptional regulator C-terminal domain-containing protein [Nocardiopsis trehalosi]
MADAALGEPDVPDPLGGDWRAGLAAWAAGAADRYRRHPWIPEVPVSRLPVMPCNLAWIEYALRVLASTPLAPPEKLAVIALVTGHVRNEAATRTQLAHGRARAAAAGGDADDAYARTLDAVVDADRFPELRGVVDGYILAATTPAPDAAEEMADFGLDRILDGIASLIDRRSR